MSSVKSVIITLPKGVPKAISRNESSLPKLNFTTSILVDKTKMDSRKMSDQLEETCDANIATFLETADTRVRGKKRRLDHLTWEEKLQRKKLKNRVAAQTSRDRKKARLDELEDTVKTQKEKTELLTQECAMLKSQNEWLLNENKRLRNERDAMRNTLMDQQQSVCSTCRTRVNDAVPSLGSAVSPNNPLPQGGTAPLALRPIQIPRAIVLLKFLTLYFLLKNCSALSRATLNDSKNWRKASYEKSVQKLKQILINQMNNRFPLMTCRLLSTLQASISETPIKKSDHPEALVGQASENVETNGVSGSVGDASLCGQNASWFLTDCDTKNVSSIKTETEIKQESEIASDLDTLYGTYDETTNSITIVYPGEENNGCMGIQECVQEVVSTENNIVGQIADDSVHLTVPSSGIHLGCSTRLSPAYANTMSPAMSDVDSCGISSTKQLDCISLSDGGYESHDSPESHMSDLFDLWPESFSELFPMLD